MNVVGDVGIMFAIFIIVARIGSIGYADVFAKFSTAFSAQDVFLVCLGLFIGCAAKSAQVPLHTWLPDAMEGPTPVSALIHAATMVTAGVYLIARFAPLWSASADARNLVGVIGALTAILGAILGCVQWDIKRILAYSTMSQIGYMIMGVGVGAYDAGVLHFLTHAFFKAQLFLTAGIVIHALHDEQDVRLMGGLRTRQPFAFVAMLVGVLAICGVPGFSGFFSKDAVLYETLAKGHPYLYAVGVITAGITAYYMFRMLFLTFLGTLPRQGRPVRPGHPPPRAGRHRARRRPPRRGARAAPPRAGLADVGPGRGADPVLDLHRLAELRAARAARGRASSTASSRPARPARGGRAAVLRDALDRARAGRRRGRLRRSPRSATGSPTRCAPPCRGCAPRRSARPRVLWNAYYFDAAYDWLLVRPARALGDLFDRVVDPHVIDAGVREVPISAQWLGHLFRSFQTGLVRAYALTIAVGVVCFVAYYAFAFGGSR